MAIPSHNSFVKGLMDEFKRDIEGLEAFKKKVYKESFGSQASTLDELQDFHGWHFKVFRF